MIKNKDTEYTNGKMEGSILAIGIKGSNMDLVFMLRQLKVEKSMVSGKTANLLNGSVKKNKVK